MPLTSRRLQLLPDILMKRARTAPNAVALLVDGGGRLTFRRWEQQSNAFARGLRGLGLHPRSVLGLQFDNHRLDDYAVAYLGAHKAGIAVVPLAPSSPRAEILRVLQDLDVVAVVHADADDTDVADATVRTFAYRDVVRGQSVGPYRSWLSPDDLGEVLYTSGSTGKRKSVAASYGNIAVGWGEDGEQGERFIDYEQRYFLHAMPFGTNAAQVTLRGALNWPPTTLVLPEFDEFRFCELIEEHQVTSVLLVPAMAMWLLRSGSHELFDLSSVREVVVTAAAMPPAEFERLQEAFPSAALHNAYSTTESWPARTSMIYDPAKPQALGRPLAAGGIRITGPDGRDVPPGTTGDIWLRTALDVPRRHYVDERADEQAFSGDWIRTGDLGHLDADGYLFLTGRDAEVFDTGGFQVSELEIETVLHEHDAVAEAAVVGLSHEVLGHVVAAAVVTTRPVRPAELRAFAADRLAAHKVPSRMLMVSELPRNAALKVVKEDVRQMFASEPAGGRRRPRAALVAPRNETEALLTRLWGAALGKDRIGVTTDFFEAGGNSLAALELTFMVRRELGVGLTLRTLLEHPTVAGAAPILEESIRTGRGAGSLHQADGRRDAGGPRLVKVKRLS